jgi:hypothetical protein
VKVPADPGAKLATVSAAKLATVSAAKLATVSAAKHATVSAAGEALADPGKVLTTDTELKPVRVPVFGEGLNGSVE